MKTNQKLLFFDVETAPNLSYHWHGKHEQEIIEIVEESYMLSFAYKWLGDKKVNSYSLATFRGNKKKLIEKLWELFNEADVVCGHNAKQFDVKWANKSFVFYELTPPSPYKVVDTLTEARSKLKLNSNRLNDIGVYLGIGSKLETGGFPLWKRCMAGEKKAFDLMEKYNRQDVALLEKVYLRLRPYMTTHPSIAIQNGYVCPLCGSKDVVSQGWKIMTTYKRKQYQCKSCGKWSTSNEKIKIRDNYLK
jgi:uncharacterized protein YprB with RNaseH-like and TPR domain